MSAKAVIRMPGDGKKVVTLAGSPMTFLLTGADTKHSSMFDCVLPSGSAVGLHVHRVHEEAFYMLEGECEWQVGGKLIRARPGTFVFVPPGVPHSIANATDKPARMLLMISPPGFEHFFEELEKLVTRDGPPDASGLANLASRYDTKQLAAPKAETIGPQRR
jgi:quercetin dioxygenase-like cupin family protein